MVHPQLVNLPRQRIPPPAQQYRGIPTAAAGVFQGSLDHNFLDLLHRVVQDRFLAPLLFQFGPVFQAVLPGLAGAGVVGVGLVQQVRGQVVCVDFPAAGHYGKPAAGVFQLAHVAGPVQGGQVFFGIWPQYFRFYCQFLGGPFQEVLHQFGDVFPALRQFGQVYANYVQAVEQVFAEAAGLHQFFQILVCGGDDAHIHFDGGGAAYPVELAIGQYSQQSGLGVGGHIADFVQKQGAAVGLLKTALAGGAGAGEGAFFVAEQFRFNQVFGDGSHVQGDERVVGPRAVVVQGLGYELLTGAAFAVDQYGNVGVGEPADGAKDLLHGRCFADDFQVFLNRLDLRFRRGLFLVAVGDGAFDQCHGFVHIKRLGQVFEGTGLIAGHRAVQVGVGGHDDNGQVRVLFHDPGQQGNAVYAGHADVADDGIRLFVLQAHHDAFTAVEYAGVQASLGQGTVQYPADAFVVVYDPDVSRSAHWLS